MDLAVSSATGRQHLRPLQESRGRAKKQKFYVVSLGRYPGIYFTWLEAEWLVDSSIAGRSMIDPNSQLPLFAPMVPLNRDDPCPTAPHDSAIRKKAHQVNL